MRHTNIEYIPVFVDGKRDESVYAISFNEETGTGLANFYGMLVKFEGKLVYTEKEGETDE